MLYRALLRFFAKREGKIHSNFDKQKLFYLASCIANCIRRRFLITQFVATEALGKKLTLQIGDSPLAVFPYLCINFL